MWPISSRARHAERLRRQSMRRMLGWTMSRGYVQDNIDIPKRVAELFLAEQLSFQHSGLLALRGGLLIGLVTACT